MDNHENEKYNQKIDNELKKKEIEGKYGAKFSSLGNLPSDIEGEWLRSIESFEEQFQKGDVTTVWNFIGKPVFKKINELKVDEISIELERIYDILNKNNVTLDTLCEVENEELYRFITEELFEQEIDDIHVEGMMSVFIYEDFHPNAEYDVKHAYNYFYNSTLAKSKYPDGDYDVLYLDMDNFQDSAGNRLEKDFVLNKLNTFLDAFDYFEVISEVIENLTINEEKTDAHLAFKVHFKGCFNNSPETVDFNGNGEMKLKPSEYGGWNVYNIAMPGLAF